MQRHISCISSQYNALLPSSTSTILHTKSHGKPKITVYPTLPGPFKEILRAQRALSKGSVRAQSTFKEASDQSRALQSKKPSRQEALRALQSLQSKKPSKHRPASKFLHLSHAQPISLVSNCKGSKSHHTPQHPSDSVPGAPSSQCAAAPP